MLRFSLFRRYFVIDLIASALAWSESIQAVIDPRLWERRKTDSVAASQRLQTNRGGSDGTERGEGPPDTYIIKAKPVPKVPAAYKPQPKPQPKPRPGAKATPAPSTPTPNQPVTRPT